MTLPENIIKQTEAPDGSNAENVTSKSFFLQVIHQFKKYKLAVVSLFFIFFLILIALFADIIANELPIYVKYNDKSYFPIFRSYFVQLDILEWQSELKNIDWKKTDFEFAIWSPIPYLPQNLDLANAQSVSPFGAQIIKTNSSRHWLGTDELGHDVLAGMIHGTRIALSVGLISVSISTFIGLLLGSLAGYLGDDRFKITRLRLIINIFLVVLAIFYAFGCRAYSLQDAMGVSIIGFIGELFISMILFIAILFAGNLLCIPFEKSGLLSSKINVPVDIIISRLIEIFVSVPQLLLIVSIVAIAKPSIFIVMTIIGLTSWTGTARFIRAELLRVRNLEYIEAAQALGYSEKRIIIKHALPNCLSPVLITAAFGIASAILIESGLSFLGIGVSAETITWGSLLSAARQNTSAWWLALFPGFAIFLTVTCFNLIGEGLTDAMNPRLRK